MTEKRESTINARVFFRKAAVRRGGHTGLGGRPSVEPGSGGWYVDFDDGEEPSGPHASELDAGKVARAVILHRSGGSRGGEDPAEVAITTIADPQRRGEQNRRQQDATHFAGSDRRFRDRRRATDYHLDRTHGPNKYAVINMREVMAIDERIDGTTTKGAEVINAINTLRHHGILNDGDKGTRGEFFVLMLKDQFTAFALLAYQAAARKAGMGAYADDVLQLSTRAGDGSPFCKLPD